MLLNYLPYFMQDIEEINKIMTISQPEIDNIESNLKSTLDDLFVIGSSETATKRYEKMLEIVPKLTDSLEKRQYDIIALYNHTLPFTLETLEEKLNAICGIDGYTLQMIYEKFTLKIRLKISKKDLSLTVQNLLEWIVPLNLIINISIDYNVWRDFSKLKWGQAKDYKWSEIKESEDIKYGYI